MRIFLDPWDSEYTAFFQVEEEQKADKIDVNVEIHKDNWIPILEKKRVVEDSVIFIDGVRSMHQRIVVEENGKIFYGGFGTYVAGALKLERGKRNIISTALIEISLKRVLLLPKGINIEKKELYIPGIPFKVKVEFIEENEPNAPLKKIQELMRTEEVRLADKVSQDYGGIPTVVDGTLYFPWKHANVVGFVKSLHTLYLPDDLIHIVLRLRKGERTPLFLIMFKDGELSKKYSWFMRLIDIGEEDFPYMGIVRLEAPGSMERDELSSLVSWSLSLRDFVSSRMRDKRSPQNLLPVGALERELKKRIGNEYLINQKIRVLARTKFI